LPLTARKAKMNLQTSEIEVDAGNALTGAFHISKGEKEILQ